jgi:putative ABC transport system permease protein
MANHVRNGRRFPNLQLTGSFGIAVESFQAHKVRFLLTALGMVIGTASLILVVTIGLTGKQYILQQIQSIGTNMMVVTSGVSSVYSTESARDDLTLDDLSAVRMRVSGIIAASPKIELHDRIALPGGNQRDILVLGVSPEYLEVRNLDVLAGRFFDDRDTQSRGKVAVLTQKMAELLYSGQDAAVGKEIKINGLPFAVIGTFKERVDTFGQTEISDDTILIPYTVARFFTNTDAVEQIFFSVADSSDIPRATIEIQQVLQSRHRPESVFQVDNLTQLLTVAGKIANALTTILLLIAVLTLLVSGVGIMNIMLATVNARIREIGIRKAVGATSAEIRAQFLTEATLISLSGGLVGIAIGMALPISVRILTNYRIPISGLSVIIAVLVSSLIGVLFGTMPAARAAKLDPVESLRYE